MRSRSAQPGWRSPTVLVTAGAVLVAVLVIGFLVLNSRAAGTGSGSGSASGSGGPLPAGLVKPSDQIPAGIPRDGRTLGSPSAAVVLDEWEDFQCPGCGLYSTTVEPQVIDRFVLPGNLRIVFHDFAFIGPESFDAASAARCAGDQGKFWDYHQWLYANQQGENKGWFSHERLAAIAGQIVPDATAWPTCYDGGGRRQAVLDEYDQGVKAGISSTPTLMIDGQKLSFGTADELLQQLQARIEAAGGVSPTPTASTVAPAPSPAPSASP